MPDLEVRLEMLTAAARYDASCASSGARQAGRSGARPPPGVCHSWSDDGRCISLLKVLMSNHCIYDCAYCANRASRAVPRASFSVEEIVELTLQFHRRNYIEGLFLSSGVLRSPDYTMERMVEVAERLRRLHRFPGYIHLKAIPGASPGLLARAGRAADRVSVNIELPTEASLRALAPDKRREDILGPMRRLCEAIEGHRADRRRDRRAPRFAPAGQSTQLIVGASPESDAQILRLSSALYTRYRLKRVYYSAFMPVTDDARLPHPDHPDLLREHRLYQADWLVRLYGFGAEEILESGVDTLDRTLDPKTAWALRHPERFPVDVQRAPIEELLRVPGLGVRSAGRIIASRRIAGLRATDLERIGVVMRRARYFIESSGEPCAGRRLSPAEIRAALVAGPRRGSDPAGVQGELFGRADGR